MLDLSKIEEPKRRWISLGGALAGVEVEIRHVGPKDQERFRQKLMRSGILKDTGIASGRETDFFRAYAEAFITDWRGDIKPEGTPYDAEKMGRVLGAYSVAFEQVGKAVAEEADFFSGNGVA